jgi:molecular chaperone DnaK (HSP70)
VTAVPEQTEVEVRVYQGEDPDALKNVPVGMFVIEGLTPMDGPNEVLCRMSLDVDGILHVTAIEKLTGKSKHVAIRDALSPRSEEEALKAQARIEDLFAHRLGSIVEVEGSWGQERDEGKIIDLPAILRGDREDEGLRSDEDAEVEVSDGNVKGDPNWDLLANEARGIVERARTILEEMHPEDREEATELDERIHRALTSRNRRELDVATSELKELLFFVEGA